ncbi:MAG: hypothetical protein ACTSPW_00645 [Promethearchaeota archaeon]
MDSKLVLRLLLLIIFLNFLFIVRDLNQVRGQENILKLSVQGKKAIIYIENGPSLEFNEWENDPEDDEEDLDGPFCFKISTTSEGQELEYEYFLDGIEIFNDTNHDGIYNIDWIEGINNGYNDLGEKKAFADSHIFPCFEEKGQGCGRWPSESISFSDYEYINDNTIKWIVEMNNRFTYANSTHECEVSFKAKFEFIVQYIERSNSNEKDDFQVKISEKFYDFDIPDMFINEVANGNIENLGLMTFWYYEVNFDENSYSLEDDELINPENGHICKIIDFNNLNKTRIIKNKKVEIAGKTTFRNEFDDKYMIGNKEFPLKTIHIPNIGGFDIRDGIEKGEYYEYKYWMIFLMDNFVNLNGSEIYCDPIIHTLFDFEVDILNYIFIFSGILTLGIIGYYIKKRDIEKGNRENEELG